MPFVFNDTLASPSSSSIALLEDIYLQGGFRVLKDIAERDALVMSSCKLGMLVRCQKENKIFELKSFVQTYDEDDNEIYSLNWQEFKIKPDIKYSTAVARPLTRWALTLRSTLLVPGAKYSIKVPVSRLVFVETISVDFGCKIWLKETEAPLLLGDGNMFNQILEHSFVEPKLTFDPKFVFPDGTKLRSRYTKTFSNKDPNSDKYVYYTLENTGNTAKNITTKFLFVSLQLS